VTASDLIPLLPLITISTASVVVLLSIAFYRNHKLAAVLSLAGLLISFAMLFVASYDVPRQITPLFILDSYALFYMGLIIATSIVVGVLSFGYMNKKEGNKEEYYALLLLATLGSAILVASSHFASFFLGLEILSVSLYALIAYPRTSEFSIEAGAKYLILAAASAAFLLFGMALVYAELGTMEFSRIASSLYTSAAYSPFMLVGLAMIVIGIGFKLAVVPFHLWTPDVYQGAPAPVTAFVATASKGAMFALMMRYFLQVNIHFYSSLLLMFSIIAIASMFIGNLLALLQQNLKRILAYSSIAHLGYLLVAFEASGNMAVTAVTFYLLAYFVTTLGAFGVITILSDGERDADAMWHYHGLGWSKPWLAAILTAMMLSLAGIPLTAGFIGKFFVVAAGIDSALWTLVVILVINSAIGLYYYLRVIIALYSHPKEDESGASLATIPTFSLAGSVVLAALTLILLWLGVYPAPLMHVIQAMVAP
jgi:NADH-quinone oxidoreductase subunit N